MKEGDYLFVYGSLRRGEASDLEAGSRWGGGANFIGEDAINGKLYRVGWYPGVKTDPGMYDTNLDVVLGDVFQINDAALITLLDGYEGYPHLFNRIETRSANGHTVWVYTYNPTVKEEARVPSGDWKQRARAEMPIGKSGQ